MTAPAPVTRPRRPIRSAALAAAFATALAGCSDGAAQDGGDAGAPTVVTATSVYADVVRAVGGDAVTVDPIIDSTAQDPHSYEATARDRLAVEKADLVVLNGGGYDVFLEDLAAAAGAPVVDALAASGPARATEGSTAHGGHAQEGHDQQGRAQESHAHGGDEHGGHDEESHAQESRELDGHDQQGHAHGGVNEHVWYDLDSMDEVARAVADRLAELDPEGAETYRANADAFADELAALREEVAASPAGDTAFVATEPVAAYLLEDAGLHDDTPVELTAAVESGTDVPPLVLQEVRERIQDGHVRLLVFNAQTASGQTEQLRQDALDADAAVIEFTETLPEGTTYLEWMAGNVAEISEALAGLRPAAP